MKLSKATDVDIVKYCKGVTENAGPANAGPGNAGPMISRLRDRKQ